MKYCGVSTLFKGSRVYNENAQEGIRVFGYFIQADQAVKIADNLFCGEKTLMKSDIRTNWEQVLRVASRNDLLRLLDYPHPHPKL